MLNMLTKKRNEQKKKKGFTLIELIIVIAIIAILAVIAIPKFMAVTKDAKIKADIANAKTIESAVTTAIATDKYKIPQSTESDANGRIIPLESLLNTIPKGKATEGDFAATVDSSGNIVVKIVKDSKATVVLPAEEGSDYAK